MIGGAEDLMEVFVWMFDWSWLYDSDSCSLRGGVKRVFQLLQSQCKPSRNFENVGGCMLAPPCSPFLNKVLPLSGKCRFF